MKVRFQQALISYGVLAALAAATLQGKVRLITLIFLAGLAVKTWIAKLQSER
jgi:hypothetical protein